MLLYLRHLVAYGPLQNGWENGNVDAGKISGGGDAERAAWTLAARVVMNLDEMIVKP